MSLRAARDGDARSCQIMVAIFLDAFQTGENAQKIPCPVIGVCTLGILFAKANTLQSDEDMTRVVELRRLYRSYSDVFRCCLHFLTSPRTEEQREHISAIKNVHGCDCTAEHGTLLAEMHQSPERNFYDQPPGQKLLAAMASALACLHDVLSGRQGIFRLARTPKWKKGRRMWPRDAGDLYPYGIHETLVNIAAWIKYAPLPTLLTLVENIHHLVAYPSLNALRLSITRDALIFLLRHALSCYAQRKSYSQILDAIATARDSIQSILTLSKECFVGVLSDKDISAWTDLIEVMCSTCVMGYDLAKYPSLQASAEDLAKSGYLLSICVLRLAILLGVTLPAETLKTLEIYREELETLSASTDRFSGLWYFVRVLHPFNNKNQRNINIMCANPACETTKLSQGGRNMPICSGCSSVSYCSHLCQRAAWKHASYPHREVCKGLHILTKRMMNHSGALTDRYKFWEICPGGELDEPLAANLGRYLAGIYGPR